METHGTCIVVCRYKDGLVLASDSRGIEGEARTIDGIQKIFPLCDGKVVVATSGPTGLTYDIQRELQKSRFNEKSTINDVIDRMETIIPKVCNSKFATEIEKGKFFLLTIVCGLKNLGKGKPMMFKITHTGYCEPISDDSNVPYFVVGTGYDHANSLMTRFYRPDLNQSQILELLSYIIHQAGLFVTSVGGRPQIAIIEPNKLPRMLPAEEIEKIMSRVATLSASVNRMLQGLFQEDGMYRTFENYLLRDLGQIVKNDRCFEIWLQHENVENHDLVTGSELSQFKARNDTGTVKELFMIEGEANVVSKGVVTIPEPLRERKSLLEPTLFWDLWRSSESDRLLTGLRIDGQDITPAEKVEYRNPEDHSEGVSYTIQSQATVNPHQTRLVEQATKTLFNTSDYILKKFAAYGTNMKVIVHKPEDIDVELNWIVTAFGTKLGGAKLTDRKANPTYIRESLEGVVIPGNGFVLTWAPKYVAAGV